ncbi:MAG: hypothetical protein ACRDN0_38435 [Trebonia sp.]
MTQVIDFVIADVGLSPLRMLRIADVVCRTSGCACPGRWVSEALTRWPGSLVAVARAGDHACVAGARGQEPVTVRVCVGDAESPVLSCASVAYWWTVSGRPLTALAGSRVSLVRGSIA